MDISSYIQSKLNEFKNTVTSGYNKVADALPLVPNTAQIRSFANSPIQYLTNPKYDYQNGNNLYGTSPFKAANAVQNFIESPGSWSDKIPRIPLAPHAGMPARIMNTIANIPIEIGASIVGKGILDPATDLGSNIGRALRGSDPLSYNQTKSPITKAGYQIAGGLGYAPPSDTKYSAQEVLGNIGGIARPIIDAYQGGAAKEAAGALTLGKGVLKTIWDSAKEGAKIGGTAGLAAGLDESRPKTGTDYLGSVFQSLATGIATGAVLSAGASTLGAIRSKLTKEILATTKGISVKDAEKVVEQFARDEMGRFVPGKKKTAWIRDAKISDAQVATLRKSMGLPVDGNYHAGFIDLNAPIDTEIFKKPYNRGDITKVVTEMDNILGVPQDAHFKQKANLRESNYKFLMEAARAGAPGASDELARVNQLRRAMDNAQVAKIHADDPVITKNEQGKIEKPLPQIDRTKLTGLQLSATNESLSKGRVPGSLPPTKNAATIAQSADSFPDAMDALAATRTSQPVVPSKSAIARAERATIQEELKRPYIDPKLSKGIKDYTSQDIPSIAGKALNKATAEPKEFDGLFSRWIGKRDSAKTKATEYVLPITKIKKEIAWDVIRSIEEPGFKATPEVVAQANILRTMFKDVRQHALDSGIDLGEIDNYFTHIWKESPEQVQQMLGASQKFKYSLERKIPTYQEGIELGLTPKYNNPAEIVEAYVKKLEQTKANIEFFQGLQKRGIVVDAAVGARTPGFEPISADGFPKSRSVLDGVMNEGQYYAPKNVAQMINRVFNPQEVKPALAKFAKVSSTMQDVLMSAGVPKTPANAWTYAQLNKEFLSGRITKPVISFLRSFSAEKSNEFFTKNAQQIIKLQERNIPINSTFNAANMVDKSAVESTLGKGVGEIWKKVTSEPTFKRFMPQLQISMFNDIEQKLLKQGKSAGEAADLAAKVVKNFYGTKGSDIAAKANPTTEAIKTSVFFAPSYRETMVTFWKNTLKSLKNPRAIENQMNARFAVGSTLAMLAADQINRALNNGNSMLSNPKGDEDKVLIPIGKLTGDPTDKTVIKFNPLFSLNFVPRTMLKIAKNVVNADFPQVLREAKGFLSTPLRPLADVATNQDYFQNDIYDPAGTAQDKYKDIGGYLGDQYVLQHPYLKAAKKYVTQTDKKPFPVAQALTEAGELPVKFSTTDKIKSQQYFDGKDQVLSGLNASERKAFDSLPKYDPANPTAYDKEDSRLRYAIFANNPKVFEAKKAIELASAKQNGTPLDPIYLLSGDEARSVFTFYQASPGSQERRDLKAQYPIINSFLDARTKYFNDKDMQAIQDQYSKGQITQDQALAATQALNDKIAAYASGGSKKPKKIAASKVRKVRFSKAKVKIGKFKPFKFPKLAKLKSYKTKKLTARA